MLPTQSMLADVVVALLPSQNTIVGRFGEEYMYLLLIAGMTQKTRLVSWGLILTNILHLMVLPHIFQVDASVLLDSSVFQTLSAATEVSICSTLLG